MFTSRQLARSLRASVRVGAGRRMPTRDILTMTPMAQRQVEKLMDQEKDKVLRIGLKTKGCNGQAYHIDFIDPKELEPLDEKVTVSNNLHLYVHRRAQISIIGTEMDYEASRLYEGFVFVNPNAIGTCGCGESFNI